MSAALAPALPPGNERHNENPGRQKGRGDPKYRELDMPGAHDVKGQDGREIDAKKSFRLSAIVRDESSGQSLQDK